MTFWEGFATIAAWPVIPVKQGIKKIKIFNIFSFTAITIDENKNQKDL
jgi:hypothetical protein